jgi:hypothetical protein
VSFFSGILYWLNLSLAVALYIRRAELSGGSVMQTQYEEIDSDLNLREEEQWNEGGMRTMQI